MSGIEEFITGTRQKRCQVVHENVQCENRVHGRGYCRMHYKRWQKSGDPQAARPAKGIERPCAVDGCADKALVRDLCDMHYQRSRSVGGLRPGQPPRRFSSDEERFWAKVDKSTDCWLWLARKDEKGYGIFSIKSRLIRAHRYAYEADSGTSIPIGMLIDHKCGVPSCVNPQHLRVVTPKQNAEHATKLRSDNNSGVRGAHWTGWRWKAVVTHMGVHYRLGSFENIADAEAAVIAKRNELFTHNDRDRGQESA